MLEERLSKAAHMEAQPTTLFSRADNSALPEQPPLAQPGAAPSPMEAGAAGLGPALPAVPGPWERAVPPAEEEEVSESFHPSPLLKKPPLLSVPV